MSNIVQDDFLKEVGDGQCTVTVITTNGYQMTGRILGSDDSTLLVDGVDGKRNLVYKSAVSTIVLSGGKAGWKN